jgi:hypothetical protein
MSGVVGWYGFKSGKPVERGPSPAKHLCWKCRDGRTRAHHRLCSKRGGKVERVKAAYMAEVLAAYRGERSPGRINSHAAAAAQAYGRRIAEVVREGERVRNMYTITGATPRTLNGLAAMLGMERCEPAAPVFEVV